MFSGKGRQFVPVLQRPEVNREKSFPLAAIEQPWPDIDGQNFCNVFPSFTLNGSLPIAMSDTNLDKCTTGLN